ncbi:MAG: hypothetical protein DRO05_02685 [Thermoproteota archaeon]|nr:MAG: hypothetical protein DRO05_02685 [Candidatus Korarchaeota archaeon]
MEASEEYSDFLKEFLMESTEVKAWIGPRGSRKTWSSQRIDEIAVEEYNKHILLVDVKGDDETLHLPAPKEVGGRLTKQYRLLKDYGLEPKGWKVKYLTFNFPPGLQSIPATFELASLTPRMISFEHFKYMGGFLSDTESRMLFDAFYDAGGQKASVKDIIVSLLRENRKVPPRLLALLTSGLFRDPGKSPLEPEKLIDIIRKHDFTVLSIAYFSGAENIGRFCLFVTLSNLLGYMRDVGFPLQIIIHLRELTAIAPKQWIYGNIWHLHRLIVDFVNILRQARTATGTLIVETQAAWYIPTALLFNMPAAFVSPLSLLDEEELKTIRKHFRASLDDEIKNKIENLIRAVKLSKTLSKDDLKGKWFFLTKGGFRAWIPPLPPPVSARIPEITREKEALAWDRWLKDNVPRVDISDLRDEAIRAYRYWKALARSKKLDRVKGLEGLIPVVELPLPSKSDLKNAPKYLAALACVIALELDGVKEETFIITGHKIRSKARAWYGDAARWLLRDESLNSLRPSGQSRARIMAEMMGLRLVKTSLGKPAIAVSVPRFKQAWERCKDVLISKAELGEVMRLEA